MNYYLAVLKVIDSEKNKNDRPGHLAHVEHYIREGKILACGPFTNGDGGAIIYIFDSLEEARLHALEDPYVKNGARSLQLVEWGMQLMKG